MRRGSAWERDQKVRELQAKLRNTRDPRERELILQHLDDLAEAKQAEQEGRAQ